MHKFQIDFHDGSRITLLAHPPYISVPYNSIVFESVQPQASKYYRIHTIKEIKEVL